MLFHYLKHMKISGRFLGFAFGFIGNAHAGTDLASISSNATTQLKSLASLLSLASYVAGISLTIGALMKFKAHKDNPTQEPIGKAVVMLVVGGCLLFIPTVITVAGSSLFGSASGGSATSFSI